MSAAKNLLLLIMIAAVTLGSLVFFILHHEKGDRRVVFELQDTDGNDVSQDNLIGKWSIITFGFTSCPDICPAHAVQIAKSLRVISRTNTAVPVQALFISVDYERDTPEALDRYLKYFHSGYIGYLGSERQLNLAVESFDGFYSVSKGGNSDPQEVSVTHSSLIYITDPYGRIVKQLPFGVTGEQIATEVGALL